MKIHKFLKTLSMLQIMKPTLVVPVFYVLSTVLVPFIWKKSFLLGKTLKANWQLFKHFLTLFERSKELSICCLHWTYKKN